MVVIQELRVEVMKQFISSLVVGFMFFVSGCAVVGGALRGAGQGLQNASREPGPTNCTTQINKYANTAYTTCN